MRLWKTWPNLKLFEYELNFEIQISVDLMFF